MLVFWFFRINCQDRLTTNKTDAATATHLKWEKRTTGELVFLVILFQIFPDISCDKSPGG